MNNWDLNDLLFLRTAQILNADKHPVNISDIELYMYGEVSDKMIEQTFEIEPKGIEALNDHYLTPLSIQ